MVHHCTNLLSIAVSPTPDGHQEYQLQASGQHDNTTSEDRSKYRSCEPDADTEPSHWQRATDIKVAGTQVLQRYKHRPIGHLVELCVKYA
jgi:hypothetical protein